MKKKLCILWLICSATAQADVLPKWLGKVDMLVSQQKLATSYPQYSTINEALAAASITPTKHQRIYIRQAKKRYMQRGQAS
ncbi:hypothetical protein [Paraglaciecola hydrolytica]|uniref:Uncharacterized protein n=1 Tax=Paraglaciecola hydrolytica TaxID=1799789 RepID=A0A148KLG7_9ALTE|nr:hypothetical protein [Paraglaciecola hydrolytica]KXI27111.1 hypothetical protein AX660_01610 [Paraglaciecola hydrolytica]